MTGFPASMSGSSVILFLQSFMVVSLDDGNVVAYKCLARFRMCGVVVALVPAFNEERYVTSVLV